MRLAVIAAALAGLATLAGPATAQGINLNGRYQATGTNFDKSRYSGTVEISYTSETSCRIVWRIGRDTYRGICMRFHDAFAATYTINGKPGLVVYRLRGDGALDGAWTLADTEGAGTELLVPQR